MNVKMKINGTWQEGDVEPRVLLVHFLRDRACLTGTHVGCETSLCGACTVLVNGQSVKSCTLFAVQADGADIMTIEGLAQDGKLHPIQQGFLGRARIAVWLLHSRHDPFCLSAPGEESEAERSRDSTWH